MTKYSLIVILGPTASGKTNFSIRFAHLIGNAEIVNADSRQLYKHMDIGTAKIPESEMAGVPHHLLSVLDPREQANIGWYKREVMKVIDAIHARGNLPMLVGGSMLYISSIIDGLEPNPHRRSGGPPSTKRSPCPYNLTIIGMKVERAELVRRINERTKRLLEFGWIEEVQKLREMGYTVDDPGFMACGYREIADEIRNKSEIRNSKLCETIAAKTRQYARRQMTWWKNDERIRWIKPTCPRSALELFFGSLL